MMLATEFRSRKRFRLAEYFQGVQDDKPLNLIDVRERVKFQRSDGKDNEIDLLAQSSDKRVVIVEVRKRQEKLALSGIEGSNLVDVEDLLDKATVYASQQGNPPILLAFLSLGGFTAEAQIFCTQQGIATAEEIHDVWSEEA